MALSVAGFDKSLPADALQSPAVRQALLLGVAYIPAVMAMVSIYLLRGYRLTEDELNKAGPSASASALGTGPAASPATACRGDSCCSHLHLPPKRPLRRISRFWQEGAVPKTCAQPRQVALRLPQRHGQTAHHGICHAAFPPEDRLERSPGLAAHRLPGRVAKQF